MLSGRGAKSMDKQNNNNMDIEAGFFNWPVTGEDHVTVVARGHIEADGVKKIFLNAAQINRMLVGRGVLIDLRRGSYRFTYRDVHRLFDELKPFLWPLHGRIALVSAPASEQSDQLFVLSVCLSEQGLEADVFYDIFRAVEWLAQKKKAPVLN
jgi:hypothetical protein